MKKFYFTFGSDEKFPYQGGWVEVIANNLRAAANQFNETYPSYNGEFLNCSDYYHENEFMQRVLPKIPAEQRHCHVVIMPVMPVKMELE